MPHALKLDSDRPISRPVKVETIREASRKVSRTIDSLTDKLSQEIGEEVRRSNAPRRRTRKVTESSEPPPTIDGFK